MMRTLLDHLCCGGPNEQKEKDKLENYEVIPYGSGRGSAIDEVNSASYPKCPALCISIPKAKQWKGSDNVTIAGACKITGVRRRTNI